MNNDNEPKIDLMYKTPNFIGSFGKKDYQFDENKEENKLEETNGLEPTYAVTGYPTELVDEKSEKVIADKESHVDLQPKQEELTEQQKQLAKVSQALKNYRDFVAQYRINTSEKDINYPEEIRKYADQKCNNCYGRGIVQWKIVLDKNEKGKYLPYNKEKNKIVEPEFCPCTKDFIMEVIKVEDEEISKDQRPNISSNSSDQ